MTIILFVLLIFVLLMAFAFTAELHKDDPKVDVTCPCGASYRGDVSGFIIWRWSHENCPISERNGG